jgi:hypothetical protein
LRSGRLLPQADVERAAKSCASDCIKANHEALHYLNQQPEFVHKMLMNTLESVYVWLLGITRTGFTASAAKETGAAQFPKHYAADAVMDVEETLWSPTLGLSGKMDMTLLASAANHGSATQSVDRFLLPVEIKTGKWNVHKHSTYRAQVRTPNAGG